MCEKRAAVRIHTVVVNRDNVLHAHRIFLGINARRKTWITLVCSDKNKRISRAVALMFYVIYPDSPFLIIFSRLCYRKIELDKRQDRTRRDVSKATWWLMRCMDIIRETSNEYVTLDFAERRWESESCHLRQLRPVEDWFSSLNMSRRWVWFSDVPTDVNFVSDHWARQKKTSYFQGAPSNHTDLQCDWMGRGWIIWNVNWSLAWEFRAKASLQCYFRLYSILVGVYVKPETVNNDEITIKLAISERGLDGLSRSPLLRSWIHIKNLDKIAS